MDKIYIQGHMPFVVVHESETSFPVDMDTRAKIISHVEDKTGLKCIFLPNTMDRLEVK